MKEAAKKKKAQAPVQRNGAQPINGNREAVSGRTVKELADFPLRSFAELQQSIADKKYGIGVDPLAAAQWSAEHDSGYRKNLITSLSVLLVLAALASVIVALVYANYWLLLALPVQALVFYVSNSNSSFSLWVTVAGAVSILVFFDLLLNQLPTAATLVAYGGLTFACVRAASYLTNQSFRKALVNDEGLFVTSFKIRSCSLRNAKTKEVFEYED